MANKKYKLADNDYWATDGVYDFGQSKTQRQINSDNTTLRGTLPTNTDLNDVTTVGNYWLNATYSYTNMPDNRTYGLLQVIARTSTPASLMQIFFYSEYVDAANGTKLFVYKRMYSGSYWHNWTLEDSTTNKNAKYRSVGNSILTGAIWKNGSFNSMAVYDDSPYAVIASSLNIPKERVSHTMLSGSGILRDGGSGNFYDYIVTNQLDLTGCDYLVTMLWVGDMIYDIGSINSPAGTTSIGAAVVGVSNYVKTNYPNTRLILIGVPPCDTTIKGEEVFSGKFSNGYSIADCNEVMRQLSKKHHFVFVDWESLALSYNYQSQTDGNNVHANNGNTYRIFGEYLAQQIANSNISASVPSRYFSETASTTERTLHIPSAARIILTIMDSNLATCARYFVISYASGAVYTSPIANSSGITFDTSVNNKLKIITSARYLTIAWESLTGKIEDIYIET